MGSFYLLILSRQHGAFFCFSQDIITNRLLGDNSFALKITNFCFHLLKFYTPGNALLGGKTLQLLSENSQRQTLERLELLGGEYNCFSGEIPNDTHWDAPIIE